MTTKGSGFLATLGKKMFGFSTSSTGCCAPPAATAVETKAQEKSPDGACCTPTVEATAAGACCEESLAAAPRACCGSDAATVTSGHAGKPVA